MDHNASPSLAEQFAAVQDWWRDAGVDHVFADATTSWLRDPEETAKQAIEADAPLKTAVAAKVIPERPRIGGNAEEWPQTFESFADWWQSQPGLDAGGARARINPRGNAAAKLMILVLEPEASDEEKLLSGPQGRLLSSFLRAARMDEGDVYFASVLPRHTPHPDWEQLASDGLGAVTLHHIGLAAPERLLCFGRGILPLIGHDPAQTGGSSPQINHQGRSFPLLVERNLDFMLARPAQRAGFWQRWLDWTG